jgi:hypothetical protein
VYLFVLVQIMIPALKLAQSYSAGALWAGLVAVALVRGTAGVSSFTAITVIMNDLISGDVGFVNGYASSVCSLSRAIAPTLMGSVFAASARLEMPFPLDYHLPFYMISALCVFTLVLSARFNNAPMPQAAAPVRAAGSIRPMASVASSSGGPVSAADGH